MNTYKSTKKKLINKGKMRAKFFFLFLDLKNENFRKVKEGEQPIESSS